jgi:hypothetical protein
MNALDAALAMMVSSYESPASKDHASQTLVKVARKVTEAKTATVKVSKNDAKPTVVCATIPVPAKGSLDATGYIVAMRNATDRDGRIKAIAAFIGYDFSGQYSSQELAANMAARRELRPIDASGPSRSEARMASASLKGFVSGMPDSLKRQIGNLLAREQVAAEARIGFLKEACKTEANDCTCCKGHAMARLEEERLCEIRKDLSALRA